MQLNTLNLAILQSIELLQSATENYETYNTNFSNDVVLFVYLTNGFKLGKLHNVD
jgi:hypothetical protein